MASSTSEKVSEKIPDAFEPEPAGATASSTPEDGDKTVEVKARPEREAGFKDYLRIFSYATKWDILMMVAGGLASIGGGVTLPLMNVVFGKLVGSEFCISCLSCKTWTDC